MRMRRFQGICFLATVSFLVLLYPLVGKTETVPFARALERIYELDFEGAYWGLHTAVGTPSEPQERVQKARVLKAIVSLSQTFSCLRLLAAYRDAIVNYDQLADKKSDVLKAFEAHRRKYAVDLRAWAYRLAEDTEEILEGRLDVELSIKYKGLKDLPTFVQEGIDRLDTVKQGLLPTPSQSRNIQTSEEYASFLSSLILALGEPFYQPSTTTIITGKVKPVHLLYYCSLWLLNASHQVDDGENLISASRKAALRGLELERKYPEPELRGKLMEILGII
jgi:hypothetical protein